MNNNIEEIESKLKILIDDFNQTMNEITQSHSQSQQILRDYLKGNISRMQRLAKAVINQYQKEDIEIHWKARRYRNWGYLNDLGGRVADRIFPFMEKTLNSHLKAFQEFLDLSSR